MDDRGRRQYLRLCLHGVAGRDYRRGLEATAAAAAALAIVALAQPAAHAQAFQCTPETAGQLSAQANVACACRFFHESGMEGTPAGYRWDCGILRPTMNFRVPATLNPFLGPVPAAVSLDRTVIQQGDITTPPANGMNGDGGNGEMGNGDMGNGDVGNADMGAGNTAAELP